MYVDRSIEPRAFAAQPAEVPEEFEFVVYGHEVTAIAVHREPAFDATLRPAEHRGRLPAEGGEVGVDSTLPGFVSTEELRYERHDLFPVAGWERDVQPVMPFQDQCRIVPRDTKWGLAHLHRAGTRRRVPARRLDLLADDRPHSRRQSRFKLVELHLVISIVRDGDRRS